MIPLYSTEETRAADNYAIKELGFPSILLMENAAISFVEAIFKKYPYLDRSYKFGLVCGKGNNGGDGFAIARHLILKGFEVKIISIASPNDIKDDAKVNLLLLQKIIEDNSSIPIKFYENISDLKLINHCDVIIDAILGSGSNGILKDPINSIVSKINEIPALKIAVDIPTGLNCETATGTNIVKANCTVSFAALKTGLFYNKGKLCSGKVLKGSIGIGETYFNDLNTKNYLIEPEDILKAIPQKQSDVNKYSAGKVLTIAGSSKYPGASIFSMNAAMMSGAGAGVLALPSSIKQIAQAKMNSAVVMDCEDESKGYLSYSNFDLLKSKIEWADAIAIGPGLGREEDTKKLVRAILDKFKNKPFVIDADAINSISNNIYKEIDLQNCIITPHHKEFADLLGISTNDLQQNILKFGKNFVEETGAILVLKGAPTIIFNSNSEVFINTSGNSGLAKFGSGDVLTGIIASFVAQQENFEKSAVASVYLHGLTADLIMKKESEFGITPDKLIEGFPSTVKFLRKSIV